MGRIPEDVIEQILNKADIESVVGKYVAFTKRTGQNLFGLCPFHSEKTASFSVSLNKNIFNCFGCHKAGNSIKFIMEIEHLTYPEAIRFLGNQYGIEVPEYETDDDGGELKNRRKRVSELLNEAARYFYSCFNAPDGKAARDYAKKRELSHDTLITYGVGYAPQGWDNLARHLRSKGYTDDEMKECGLFTVSRKTGKLIDLLRGRFVFPIFDYFGNIIAFGGRSLGDELPKYVNSPDSLVYKKQEHLYGLNFAKDEASKRKQLIIVEGYMDTVQMHQAGITNVAAALGTAFTDSQLRLAAKVASEVVFFFDSDKAGQAAAIRAVHMMLVFQKKMAGTKLRIKIAAVPDGKDPDEYIKLNGAESFRAVVAAAKDADDYLFDRAYNDNCDEKGALDLYNFQEKVIEYGSWITDELKREKVATKAAQYLGANPHSVLTRMNDLMESDSQKRFEMELRMAQRAQQNAQPQIVFTDDEPEAGVAQPQVVVKKGPRADLVYIEELELFVYAMRLKERLALQVDREDVLRVNDFVGENMKAVVEYFLKNFNASYGVREDILLNKLANYKFNGKPADEVYLNACYTIRDSNIEKVQLDSYLLKLYEIRIKKLDMAERKFVSKLTSSNAQQREEIKKNLKKIEVYRDHISAKKESL